MINIIRFNFLDIRKRKVLYVSMILSIVLLSLYGFMVKNVYSSHMGSNSALMANVISQQIITLGLSMASFIVSFLAIFLSCGVISSEIESGILDAIVSKPISRVEYYLGKLIVIWSILIIYSTILFLGVIFFNLHFYDSLNLKMIVILKALIVLWFVPIIFSTIGLYLSIYFSTVNSGIILIGMYFIATIGTMIERVATFVTENSPISSQVLSNIGIFISLLIPSDVICKKSSSILFTSSSGMSFNIFDNISQSSQPSTFMMIYILIYILFFIFLGMKKFKNKDL